MKELLRLGIPADHGYHRQGVYIETDLSEKEIMLARQAGFATEILILDVQEFYTKQVASAHAERSACLAGTAPGIITPQGFGLGSMGGFYTYQEMLDRLDTMAARFPSLVKIRTAIDTTNTIEGRPIYYVKISDNPNTDEAEPEVLYTGLHHAREPAGMQQLIFYMFYLLENYQADQEIAYLIDNTELYFIPCINPDGYIHNETTNPAGGGMWRKNRRNNGDGTYGIDLNRNYGYEWGYDNTGSSPTTSSDTYRGTAGFSEPETQAMRNFADSREFRTAINYHTYGNLLIYPWGYQPVYTPDSALFSEFAKDLTADNNYRYGTSVQTVNYSVNGSSDDWMYGDTTNKPAIFSMTPEAGHTDDGFWPASSKIEDICKVNITQNLKAARIAGRYGVARDKQSEWLSQSGYLKYEIQSLGLEASSFTVTITPIGSEIASIGTAKTYTGIQTPGKLLDSISYTLASALPAGQEVRYLLSITNGITSVPGPMYTHSDTVIKTAGTPVIAYANNGTTTNTSSTGWGVTGSYYFSPPNSLTDSPFGNYNDNDLSTLSLTAINLNNCSEAYLTFKARWEIETGWDYAQVQISSNNGATWTSLCGKHTKTGNMNQAQGEPLYDGFQMSWIDERVDLSAYLNMNVQIRFALVSDSWQTYDGLYLDDIYVEKLPLPSGIDKPEFSDLQLYPNPSDGKTTISTGSVNSASIVIVDNLGQEVYRGNISRNSSLDLSYLPTGTYSVVIGNGESIDRRKLVIVK